MWQITPALRAYGKAADWWNDGASDAVIRSQVGTRLANGELNPAKLAELTAPEPNPADRVRSIVGDAVRDALNGGTRDVSPTALFSRAAQTGALPGANGANVRRASDAYSSVKTVGA